MIDITAKLQRDALPHLVIGQTDLSPFIYKIVAISIVVTLMKIYSFIVAKGYIALPPYPQEMVGNWWKLGKYSWQTRIGFILIISTALVEPTINTISGKTTWCRKYDFTDYRNSVLSSSFYTQTGFFVQPRDTVPKVIVGLDFVENCGPWNVNVSKCTLDETGSTTCIINGMEAYAAPGSNMTFVNYSADQGYSLLRLQSVRKSKEPKLYEQVGVVGYLPVSGANNSTETRLLPVCTTEGNDQELQNREFRCGHFASSALNCSEAFSNEDGFETLSRMQWVYRSFKSAESGNTIACKLEAVGALKAWHAIIVFLALCSYLALIKGPSKMTLAKMQSLWQITAARALLSKYDCIELSPDGEVDIKWIVIGDQYKLILNNKVLKFDSVEDEEAV